MKKTTVYLEEEILTSLKIIARRESRSEAEVIREGLAEYVAGKRRKLPSFVGMVADGAISAANDEEYLEQHWKPDW